MPVFNIYFKKADRTLEIDTDHYPVASRLYAEEYGWRQSVNDSAASVKMTDSAGQPLKGEALKAKQEEAWELMSKKLDNLRDGILRRVRTGDAVMAEAKRIAYRLVQKDAEFKAWVAEKPDVRKAGEKAHGEEVARRANVLIETDERIMEIAERRVEEMAELEA